MGLPNATEIAGKWVSGMSGSRDRIRRGVEGVTENPAEKAIEAQDRYVNGVQRAVEEGRYARGLRKVTLQSWKQAFLNKGLDRISSGATNAKADVESFWTEFIPHLQAGQDMLKNMPKDTLDQRIDRAVANIRHNAKFRRSR